MNTIQMPFAAKKCYAFTYAAPLANLTVLTSVSPFLPRYCLPVQTSLQSTATSPTAKHTCTCTMYVAAHTVINPRRACAARVTVLGLSFCPSVRLSVTTFSATTRNKAAKKRYQRVQCHTGLILKRAIFVKVLRSKVMA